ncbi:GH3 family domain-containing protein [Psychroflexus sp. MES1-P1E]|uniref:GH3 family domain-containing protein n=1 Tax=Psychroflexus sp. MES1-P1E TaxID=2058320 RepID=UPI000C7A90F7|nr:GH3 auxin-responsive promoter family protein [Psychroflexus sp. MES1-P1E]PKG41749.1 GH3 auxin-responsive promoter [Psychroflexus sp. MES1-P1E]
MAILGNIIKGVINLRNSISSEANHVQNQKETLEFLLEKAKSTEFGKHYKFDELLASENPYENFKSTIPYFDYDKIHTEWWYKLHKGEKDITWPGHPDYFALSSGTTGKTSKRIPVTEDMIEAIRNAGIKQILAIKNFDLPADFFEKEIMMLGSSTNLDLHNDHIEGEISGISASRIPFWFRGFYKPGEDISKIDDWDDRIQKIAETAKSWDIGALSGIPSWMELMMEKVIDYHKVETIHDVWPNLKVYTSGGVAFGPYQKSFKRLTGQPVQVIDTYLASEGFIALQTRPETNSMQLLTDNGIFFEFVPFQPQYIRPDGSLKPDSPCIRLEDVELEQDYVLIISTVSGAWRYTIGDTIQFTDVKKAEIQITGRTKFFLNTVGSQLSVNKMDTAMKELEDQFDIDISEYTICAKRAEDGEFYHFWYLGTSHKDLDISTIAKALDDSLKSANKNYQVARDKALNGVKVTLIDPTIFQDWSTRNKKKGGQVKMERVMNEEKFSEWENFVKIH